MVKRKAVRTRGKIKFSEYFKELKIGDSVSIVVERALNIGFPKNIQGRTGVVVGKRGKAYIIKIGGRKKDKEYLIEPVHLKKIKLIETNDKK